jgi:hypothetical protein
VWHRQTKIEREAYIFSLYVAYLAEIIKIITTLASIYDSFQLKIGQTTIF